MFRAATRLRRLRDGARPLIGELPRSCRFGDPPGGAVQQRRRRVRKNDESPGLTEPEVILDSSARSIGVEVLDETDAHDHFGLRKTGVRI